MNILFRHVGSIRPLKINYILMKNYFYSLVIIILLIGCQNKNSFTVEGNISSAKGEKLYIEHMGLLKTTSVDSVKLGKNGKFHFTIKRPEYPDFYRLRLNDKLIIFAVDSTEKITIKASKEDLPYNYTLTGSEQSLKIQQLRKSVANIQNKINKFSSNLAPEEQNQLMKEIEKDIENHKREAQKLILENPRSTAAYYALYQKVNDFYLFSPYVKEDRSYCAAVATAYHTFMPNYTRSQNLYATVMDAIKNERKAESQLRLEELFRTNSTGYINIVLPDKNGIRQKLSDLEGKIVLIDFSIYTARENVEHTFTLRELYNKYHERGFEIFQVSLDENRFLWEKYVQNIPWICVRDERGPNTPYVLSYNISTIPASFLMDRQGNIIARDLDFKQLDKQIAKLL